MITYFTNKTSRLLLVFGVIVLGYFVLGTGTAHAASVMLAVNGGASASVDNGSTIILSWQASGVTGCSINNGIGAVPLIGTRSVVPPNTGATYTITCSGMTDSAIVTIKPYISIYGSPSTVTPNTPGGPGPVTMTWDATNATQCTLLTARGVTSGVTRTLFSNVRAAQSSINDSISEQTVYTISCNNQQNGQSRNSSVTVSYGAIGDPLVTKFTINRTNPGNWDPNWAGLLVRLEWASTNATKCVRSAHYANGTTYTLSGWTATVGGSASSNIQGAYTTVISTSTIFRTNCGRTSDNKWNLQEINFVLNPNSSSTPSVAPTADLIAPASVSVPLASNLPARVSVQTDSNRANRCTFIAYNATTNATTTVSGWTDRLNDWYRMNGTFDVLLNESTRLLYQCYRTSDGAIVEDDEVVNVSVLNTAQPALTLQATPAGVSSNVQTVRLAWTGYNISSCNGSNVIQGGVVTDNWYLTGTIPLSGVKTVSVYGDTTYALTCLNSVTSQIATATVSVSLVDGEVVVASVNVNVNGNGNGNGNSTTTASSTPLTQAEIDAYRSSVTITADPRLVRQQQQAEVSWTAHEDLLTGCTLYEGNAPVLLSVSDTVNGIASGVFLSRPLRVERVFTIDCQIPDATESASFSASVRVLPKVIES